MSNSFEDSATQIAYNSIHDFFDVCNLDHAVKYTEDILQAAVGQKIWRKEAPSNLLFYMENFTSLYKAAFSIHYNYSKRTEAVIDPPENGVPDVSVTQNFMNERMYQSSVWSKFPRHLSEHQYHDPYKAVKRFCTYMAEPEWENYLKDVTEFALSKDTLDEVYHPYNILTVRLRMMQLIEACHLIDIRTNVKKAKPKKDKKKKQTK
jgi:hypothetical protein